MNGNGRAAAHQAAIVWICLAVLLLTTAYSPVATTRTESPESRRAEQAAETSTELNVFASSSDATERSGDQNVRSDAEADKPEWIPSAVDSLVEHPGDSPAVGGTKSEVPVSGVAETVSGESEWIVKWRGEKRDEERLQESELVRDDPEHRISVVRPRDDVDASAWLNRWRKSRYVQYIQPNHRVTISAVPDDTLYRFQQHLGLIKAEQAWERATGSDSLIIAVVDTGVDLTHPDLKDNLVTGVNLIDPGKPPQDDHGHGTNVAGVIGAVGNNKTGVTGVAWKAKLMPIKALEADGSGSEDQLGRGIRYAMERGAKIVVLSLGLYHYSEYMSEIVREAEQKGVLLVAATGNDGKDIKYPAAYPTVLAVGGVKADKQRENRSNFGPEIDVVAPWKVFTTALNGGYDYNEGTSMAAPQVAAVAALLWSQNPSLTPSQIRSHIRSTAEDLGTPGWDPYTGAGLVQADRALTLPFREDGFEPNETPQAAAMLPVPSQRSAASAGGGDRDWYKVEAKYDGTLTFKVDVDRPEDAAKLAMRREGGGLQAAVFSNLANPVEFSVKKGQTYYVSIYQKAANSRETIPYRLTTDFTIAADAFEDNDRQYKAYRIPSTQTTFTGTFHKVNDEDWFVYEVEQAGTLQFQVSANTYRMDLAMLIFREGGTAQFVDYAGDGGTEISPVIDVLPGKYYVRVTNLTSSGVSYPVVGQYVLKVDYAAKRIDPYEPNNRFYQATSVSSGKVYAGLLDTESDEDWFTFQVNGDSYVHVQLRGIPVDTHVSVTLFDESQQTISAEVNKTGTTSIRLGQKLSKGKYYVRLTANRPIKTTYYELEIRLEALVEGYRDVANSWALDAIRELNRRQIINGYPDHTFRPDAPVTRAEAAALLARVRGWKGTSSVRYKDVPERHWAAEAVSAATAAGVFQGYADGSFQPDRPISRAEMAAVIVRFMEATPLVSEQAPFSDVPAGHWAAGSIWRAKERGWLKGYPGGTFHPGESTTREEFAAILYRLIQS